MSEHVSWLVQIVGVLARNTQYFTHVPPAGDSVSYYLAPAAGVDVTARFNFDTSRRSRRHTVLIIPEGSHPNTAVASISTYLGSTYYIGSKVR
ncbi:hypothetical protein KC335_g120 [Hortaea werneckii]|nr:hypothetical protein KC335_g120 [Hortaea werneckii]